MQHSASLPAVLSTPQAEYWLALPEVPQQSPPSQLQPQLLLTELHLPLPMLLVLPVQEGAHRLSSKAATSAPINEAAAAAAANTKKRILWTIGILLLFVLSQLFDHHPP